MRVRSMSTHSVPNLLINSESVGINDIGGDIWISIIYMYIDKSRLGKSQHPSSDPTCHGPVSAHFSSYHYVASQLSSGGAPSTPKSARSVLDRTNS